MYKNTISKKTMSFSVCFSEVAWEEYVLYETYQYIFHGQIYLLTKQWKGKLLIILQSSELNPFIISIFDLQ